METLRTFDDGTVVRRYPKRLCHTNWGFSLSHEISGYDHNITSVETPCGRRFEFYDRYRALLWGALWTQTGGTRFVTDREVIPYNVAALGNAAIAAYLSAVHPFSLSEVAEILDVSPRTVIQYRTDFLDGRR